MSERDPLTSQPSMAAPTAAVGGQPPGQSPAATDQATAKASEKAGAAKDKAMRVEDAAEGHARNVANAATGHAGEVLSDAKQQAGNLAQEGLHQVRQQADAQTDRAASYLQDMSEQLRKMGRGEGTPAGPLASVVEEGARRAEDLATRLRTGGLDLAVRDVQRFARQRPGMFLATAFGAGLAVGRLVRNTDTSRLTSDGDGGREQASAPGGVPDTGRAGTGLANAPTMPGAEPYPAGAVTGVQGGQW
jgi:hypothetical protein